MFDIKAEFQHAIFAATETWNWESLRKIRCAVVEAFNKGEIGVTEYTEFVSEIDDTLREAN